ncbi:MAG: GNAT family N-acetyltransferase [Colwellia sp.]|jgi:Acetyltransferases
MGKYVLVKSVNHDHSEIREIWCKANAYSLGFADAPEFLPILYMQFKAKMCHYQKSFPTCNTYLIYDDNLLCGYILTSIEGCTFRIIDIEVLPQCQGKGIGSWVIDKAIASAGEGISLVRLSVLKTNNAKALYIKLGFTLKTEDDIYFHLQKIITSRAL